MGDQGRRCGICDDLFFELGLSPFCEGCGKVMCQACERKHNKAECKDRKEGRL